jgi:uncharacterized protein (TIGR02246 family)
MKKLLQQIGLTTVCLVLLSPHALTASLGTTRATIEAKKVVEAYFQALNNSQLEIIVGLYHKDSVFLPKNAPAARGLDAITKAYRTLFTRAKLNTQHVYHQVAVYGDVAIIECQGHGTLTLLDSNTAIASNNKELFVLRKIGKQWKIDRYMFNDSEKPAA